MPPGEPRRVLLTSGVIPDNRGKFACATLGARHLVESFSKDAVEGRFTLGGNIMSGQVILYFEDQTDALRFALAAGSVMAGDGPNATGSLMQETARVTRIRLDAANAGKTSKSSPPERAA